MADTVNLTLTVRIVKPQAFQSDSAVGKAMRHPDGRLVYITGGRYLSGGRISNFWSWQEILPDGSLSEKVESGYGW